MSAGEEINGVEFTKAENKIRKRWLFFSTLLPAFVVGCIVISSVFSLSVDFGVLIGVLLVLLFFAGGFYMNYHCAYKKPGTVLLLLMMIGVSLSILTTFVMPENLAMMQESPLFMLTMLLFEIIVVYYSYKLREINKKMKERTLAASPEYINALSVFSTATNLEELNNQFSRLRTLHDSGSAVVALCKAYDQQKKMFTE